MEKPESINCCIAYYGSSLTLKVDFLTLWPNILEKYVSAKIN